MDLQQITQVLLAEELDYALLQQAALDYRALLTKHSLFKTQAEEAKTDIHLESGKAIGSTWAALCIDDLLRTKRFVKGVYEAVKSLLDEGKASVEILYAGSGPFATLVLPLTTIFREDQVRIRALEINPASGQHLKQLIGALGIEGYFRSIEQVDASCYQIPNANEIDILLSETMQRGLEKEPQVAIMYNLVPQLREDVILIPEKIELSLGTLRYQGQPPTQVVYNSIINIFSLDKERILKQRAIDLADGSLQFPSRQYQITRPEFPASHRLALFTQITVFGQEELGPGESGITLPIPLSALQQIEKEEFVVEWAYEMGSNPGMRFREVI